MSKRRNETQRQPRMPSFRRSLTTVTMKTMLCRTWPRHNHLKTILCRCATHVQAVPPGTRAFSSAAIVGDRPVLVRDFIRSALYDPEHGYFSRRWGSVGVLDRSIQFHRLQGRKAYMEHLDNIYRQNDISWFTPVELFKPWYAHGIAEAILRTANLSYPLKKMFGLNTNGISMTFNDFVSYIHGVHGYEIFEIGGGSGTCAKGIMDYIMLNAPERVYNTMTYISVEISSSLADTQRKTVGEVSCHALKHRVECRDATDQLGWGETEQQPCWVIMLEVLDNLPHDLIYAENQVSPWKEVWVEKQPDRHTLSELYKPLTDPLILRCLDLIKDEETASDDALMKSFWSRVFPRPRRYWLPTGCLKLLEVLHKALPKMSLVVSDFSYLPDVRIAGDRAPLVSTKKEGKSTDYNSYLDAKGDADIFFPTDFWLLERIDHFCSGWPKLQKDKSSKQGRKRRTMSLDTSSFMEEFGIPSKTRTKDGYNPLLEDFKNTKFYLSVPTHNIK